MTQWIVVPDWERFQHYKNRNPYWIKLYTELNSDPHWDALTLPQRGLMVTIWIEYARSRGRLTVAKVRHTVPQKVRYETLEALSHAGFIQLCASKPRSIHAMPEEETDREVERDQDQDQNPVPEPEPSLTTPNAGSPEPQLDPKPNGHGSGSGIDHGLQPLADTPLAVLAAIARKAGTP